LDYKGELNMNTYLQLTNTHEKEFNSFPIFWAFSDKQFKEGMEKFGLAVDDIDKLYKLSGGGFYRKTDSKAFRDLLDRHEKEMSDAIAADKTGEGFILEMFDYELSNHEFTYTGDTEDTIDALGLSQGDFDNNPALKAGLRLAIKAQYANQE
jgi:hypothetical protein